MVPVYRTRDHTKVSKLKANISGLLPSLDDEREVDGKEEDEEANVEGVGADSNAAPKDDDEEEDKETADRG